MDEQKRCRLLSSVYQPFVNIGCALLHESEQLLNQIKSFNKASRVDANQLFLQAIELLARLSKETKAWIRDENRTSGWPLCTDRYIIFHLGDPLVDRSIDRCVERFKAGDFYYSIIPVNAPSTGNEKITCRLALYHFDSSRGGFQQTALQWDDLAAFLRNCRQSTTANDLYSQSKEHDRSVELQQWKKHLFRRCVVRNGKNSDIEVVRWKQLCHSAGHIRNGQISYAFTGPPSTPLLDFIDDYPAMSKEDLCWAKTDQLEVERTNEDSDNAKASLCSVLSSPTSNSSRIPKRITEVCSEFFSHGFISFTGGRYRGDERYALVEIRLADGSHDSDGVNSCCLNERTSNEFANALMYLYSIHRRCVASSTVNDAGTGSRECGLVFVVGLTTIESSEEYRRIRSSYLLRCFKKVLDLYMQRFPNGADALFVDAYPEELVKLLSEMNEGEKEANVTALTPAELHEQVASASELSDSFGGTLTYDRKRWVAFRQDLERFKDACETVAKICISNNQVLNDSYSDAKMASFWALGSSELDSELSKLKWHEAQLEENQCTVQLMAHGDDDLRSLQESFDDLKQLRSYREYTDKIGNFYNELLKTMVKVRSGTCRRVSLLEAYVKAKRFIERSEKVIKELDDIALSLKPHSSGADGARHSRATLQRLVDYSNETVQKALAEAKDAMMKMPADDELGVLSTDQKEVVLSVSERLQRLVTAVSDASELALKRAKNLVECHDFLDQAYYWAVDGREMLKSLDTCTATQSKKASDELHLLLSHLSSHPPIAQECFAEKLRMATGAGDESLRIQCKAVQERCANTERELLNWVKFLERAAESGEEDAASVALSEAPRHVSIGNSDQTGCLENRPVQRRRPSSTMSASLCLLSPSTTALEVMNFDLDNVESSPSNEKTDFTGIITVDLTETVVSEISENTLRKKRGERMAGHNSISQNGRKCPLPAPPPPSAGMLMTVEKPKTRRPFRKLMKRSNTCDDIVLTPKPTRHQSLESLPSISEESSDGAALTTKSVPLADAAVNEYTCAGNDEEPEERVDSAPPFVAPVPPPANAAFITYDRLIPSPPPDCSPNVRMQHMVANELLLTEEAYAASLQYVIEHYLSELHRTDLPHQLLGHRVTIFGNIEKIYEFHCGQFLPELKRNCSEASDALGAQVAKCFLKYRTKFHLYALYNKNKPKSDALMAECAAVFFRTKQLLLRDKLDLSSYLLKPVQRMGKYALMLQQLIKACPSYDQEQLEALKTAEDMVTFQLRHGNDLLAMDSIQHCDMNLKEQGQLLRQDEFIVFEGRGSQKRIRRVFLFEHLVLFTKPRRIRGMNGCEREIFESKRCMKMNDVGLTEQVGDSTLKFELWFLRHTSGQRFVLQAQSPSVREAWISFIRRILWKQVLSHQELRKAEISSMGGKMCMDLKPSKDRIEDRALNASLLMKVSQSGVLSSQLCSDFGQQVKRPHSIISVGSSASSSNISSTTDSSGYRMQVTATSGAEDTATASSESGICCHYVRPGFPASIAEDDLADDGSSVCDSSECSSVKDREGLKQETVDGAEL